ncbi:MAG: hypothetical protein N3E44_02615 [Candidatus Bathyarchaeota archaeon]|nr:hypothetical protein [Candidatus Bathyarchaeota archaeon]
MKNRREAISPVIATLIIIAVTIAISLAVAAWLMGLWGGLIGGPRISASLLKIATIATSDNGKINATVLFSNTGNAPDKIVSTAAVTLRVGGSVYTAAAMNDRTDAITIDPTPPGTTETVKFTFNVGNASALLGSTATIEIRFQSGNTIILTGTIVQETK